MRKCMLNGCVALAMAASGANLQAALTDNFNAPTYTDASIAGQNGWTTTFGASGYPITVENTAIDGRVRLAHRAAGGLRDALKVITSVGPGGDGKIYIHVDEILGGGDSPATLGAHLMFRDSAGAELFRFDIKPSGIRGRVAGGGGIVTPYMMVDSPNPSQRTIWAVVDTAGAGGSVKFYQDSILPANELTSTGITYPASTLDAVSQVYMDSTDSAGNTNFELLDNISVDSVVPEPSTLGLLALGAIAFLRVRRTA